MYDYVDVNVVSIPYRYTKNQKLIERAFRDLKEFQSPIGTQKTLNYFNLFYLNYLFQSPIGTQKT